MKATRVLSNIMRHVKPEQYINMEKNNTSLRLHAVERYLKHNPPLSQACKVFDFGCGTGDTTLALSEGRLGALGKPAEVLGADISLDMINYCQAEYESPSLRFQTVNVEDCETFAGTNTDKFDLATSFLTLMLVPNQPAAITVFNRLLKKGGRFLFVFLSEKCPQGTSDREVFQVMKEEDKWKQYLEHVNWPHYTTIHTNNTWMSIVQQNGHGHIIEKDFVNLLTNNGFKVKDSTTERVDLLMTDLFFHKTFEQILQSIDLPEGDESDNFRNEYQARVASNRLEKVLSNGCRSESMNVVTVFGEKIDNNY